MAGDRSEIRESGKATFLGKLAGRIMQAYCATLRFEIVDRCGLTRPGGIPGPVIYCLWHNRIFTVPAAWKMACGRHRRAVVLTSASQRRAGDSHPRRVSLLLALENLGPLRDSQAVQQGPRHFRRGACCSRRALRR